LVFIFLPFCSLFFLHDALAVENQQGDGENGEHTHTNVIRATKPMISVFTTLPLVNGKNWLPGRKTAMARITGIRITKCTLACF
jgi:hypothetical protein